MLFMSDDRLYLVASESKLAVCIGKSYGKFELEKALPLIQELIDCLDSNERLEFVYESDNTYDQYNLSKPCKGNVEQSIKAGEYYDDCELLAQVNHFLSSDNPGSLYALLDEKDIIRAFKLLSKHSM